MKYYLIFVLFILLKFVNSTHQSVQPTVIEQKIKWLYERLLKNYWKKDQKYQFPIIQWEHKKGLFSSSVHFNYLDKRNSKMAAWVRDKFFHVDDNNMFVTSFILYGLIQAEQLGTIKVNQHLLSESIMAISSYRDKNTPDGIPQYTFWPQKNINGTWTSQAQNLIHSINFIPQPPKYLEKFLQKIGLGILYYSRSLSSAFCIPADNDDSSVNLALMGLLKQSNSPHFQFWNSLNLNKQTFYERALRYAYRPFASNYSLNKHADQIDPRTYYVLRKFIDEKRKQSENASLILPTTWLINTEQQVPGLIIMPFKSNNVDASVSANFLFGLCYQLINKQVVLNDELTQMMLNTVELLQFTVTHILTKRPTLILVYYPSKYDFFWFVARIVGLLKRHQLGSPLLQVRTRLQRLMKEVSTKQIISSAVKNADGYHWKQFLGNYAKKQRQQDAIFSSSLALNALLDTWTTRNGKNLSFDKDITSQVKTTLEEGVKHLIGVLKPKMKELNAFFSGSMKVFNNTFPYFFPSNLALDGKDNQIDPNNLTLKNLTFSTKVFVKGYIQAEKYQEMLKKKWFGNIVPQDEVSLNTGQGLTFPFWSSSAITEVMSISSLSKYLKVISKISQKKLIRTQQIKDQ